ncbi:MAG: hypothetical protein ACOYMN_19335, partial [Roseimicrobium sp.]
MPPSVRTLLVLAYFGLLAWGFARVLKAHGLRRLERVLGAWLLVWLSLVLSGGVCAIFSRLGDGVWYFGLNALTALGLQGVFLLLAKVGGVAGLGPESAGGWAARSRWDRGVVLGCLGAFAVGLVLVTAIGWWHGPTLDDCLACKLPRTGFFALHGNILPPEGWSNTRIFGAPPYCSMLQLPFWIAGADVASYNLLGSVTWLLMAAAVALSARACGAAPPGSALAAFCFSFSALILQKGSSENDDLLSSLPTVLSVYFFLTACAEKSLGRFLVGGVAFGLALGGKLLALYFAAPFVVIWLWYFAKESPDARWQLGRGALAFGSAALLAAAVFFAQNWFMYGFPLPRSTLIEMNRNTPFQVGTFAYNVAGQTLACLASAPMNVAALLESCGLLSREALDAFVAGADRSIGAAVLDHLSRVPAPSGGDFSIAPYIMAQTFDPMRELNESNNSFGILALALPCAVLWLRRGPNRLALVFAALGLLGFLQYCATFKFILQTTRYFTPFVALGMPAFALLADRCVADRHRWWARGLTGLAVLYTVVFAVPAWWHGRDRQIQRLVEQVGRAPLPVERDTAPKLQEFLRTEPKVNVLDTYELPFF